MKKSIHPDEFIRLRTPKNMSFSFEKNSKDKTIISFISETLGIPAKNICNVSFNACKNYADVIYCNN